MAEYQRPKTEADLEINFEQMHPTMDATMAHYASAKCLYCYDAPCITACPSGIDIPLFIRQIRTGNLDGSAKTIYDANYFGNICGKVCPTEVLCEGACVYNEQDVEPVEIGALQSYACSHAIENQSKLWDIPGDNGRKVAIIGAGPAGIACACELRKMGYRVDVFDARDKGSGLALYGCAPYKITNDEVLNELDYLHKQFQFNLHLGHVVSIDELQQFNIEYDAVFLGIGLGDTRAMHVPGEELPGCLGATEFIKEVKINPLSVDPGERVVVIGGGNTAMDAASESARLGASSVILAYRRSRGEMGAYDFEYELAKGAGVKALFNVMPIEIQGDEHVEGITMAQTFVQDGRVIEAPDTRFTLTCDRVIKATGQTRQEQLLKSVPQLELDHGKIKVNHHGQTTNPKFFAGGDAVNGGAEVVNAAAEGKVAARGIAEWLRTNSK